MRKEKLVHTFKATIYIIGINPCVDVPGKVMKALLGRKKTGNVPVKGNINGFATRATLVPVKARTYRLFINGEMRRRAGVKAGDTVKISLEKDEAPRELPVPFVLALALEASPSARAAWEKLPPSHKKEYLAYLNFLKTPDAFARNVKKVIQRLEKVDVPKQEKD